jgi:hypothetical protein
MESASGHDEKLWAGLMELGVGGLVVPAAYGGLERELLDLALVAEELGYAAVPGPFLGSAMATVALAEGGDAAQREKWLTRLAAGEAIGAVALGEDDAEWNPERFQASVKHGRISGTKPLVLGAALADFIIVTAKDEKGSAGLWLVERGAQNLRIEATKGIDMTRRLDRVELRYPGRAVPGRRRCNAPSTPISSAGRGCYGGAALLGHGADVRAAARQFRQPIGRSRRSSTSSPISSPRSSPACRCTGTRRTPSTASRINRRATRPWPRPTCAMSSTAPRAIRPSFTAASASLGSSISTCGSAARSSIAATWAIRPTTGRAADPAAGGRRDEVVSPGSVTAPTSGPSLPEPRTLLHVRARTFGAANNRDLDAIALGGNDAEAKVSGRHFWAEAVRRRSGGRRQPCGP